jgi:1-acyl-sn-glycerol-3-phosphate acyltransferase
VLTFIKLFFIIIYTIICSILALIFSLERSFFLYFWLTKAWPKGILIISGVKLKISGLENIDKNAIYVFVSNHSSQFDIPALQYGIPNRFSIIFKKELGKIPLFGWQLQTGPYIMIDRQNAEKAMKSMQKAKERMNKKRMSALLFAEGTRSKTGEVQAFKRGAFHLAAEVKFPVVPVSISGADKLLPKGKFKIKPGTIYIHFDKPIPTENISSRKDELELMEKVRDIVIENIKKEI